jgi:hypothetical protein
MPLTDLKLKPYARLAALGALGVAGGATAFYLFLVYGTRSVPLGGIDGTQAVLSALSLLPAFALIVAVHLVAARVLFRYANET